MKYLMAFLEYIGAVKTTRPPREVEYRKHKGQKQFRYKGDSFWKVTPEDKQ